MKNKGIRFGSVLLIMAIIIGLTGTPTIAAEKGKYKVTKVEHDLVPSENNYFHEGLVPVLVNQQEGGWQYMNKKGELIDYGYSNLTSLVSEFSEGLAAVVKGTHIEGYTYDIKLGYIDPTGKVIIPFEHEAEASMGLTYTGRFIDGYAKVYKRVGTEHITKVEDPADNPHIDIPVHTQYSIPIEEWYTIDKTGKRVDVPVVSTRPEGNDIMLTDFGGYVSEDEKPVDIIIEGKTIENVRFSEDLALVFLKRDGTEHTYDGYIVERGAGAVEEEKEEEVEEKEEEEKIPTGSVSLKFTSWTQWDGGTTLDYKLTNNSNEVAKGSYGVIICGRGYDSTTEDTWSDPVSRYSNKKYYPLEGHIFDYEVGPMQTIDGWIESQLYGEQDTDEEDLAKSTMKYIVIPLKSEAEKKKLQSEMDSVGLGILDDHTAEENDILQNWLEANFGVLPTGGQ